MMYWWVVLLRLRIIIEFDFRFQIKSDQIRHELVKILEVLDALPLHNSIEYSIL